MADLPEQNSGTLIGGQYLVDVTRRLPDAGGGVMAFAASSLRTSAFPLMALRVDRHAPARPRTLHNLVTRVEGLLTPLAHGIGPPIDGQAAWFVICQAPAGSPVSSGLRPWPETTLIEFVMRPIAAVLEQLQARGITHRGIRPNNVFQIQPNRPVTLGAAWSAPAAMHQPAVCETAYTALCHPAARGEGRTADDVYALGVLLVTLALGRPAMDGADDRTIMYRKLELGDFVAITGGERLPPILYDLTRGMLAEDPDHRPPPALLRDPSGARGRRVAARPASRAQRSFKIGAITVWNNRTLALAMALDPAEALIAIQGGTLMYWLRRGLGDSGLAVKLEELVRQNAQDTLTDKETALSLLTMRAITDADLLMPLCWRGLAIFPDGLGPVLAAALENEPGLQRNLHDIVNSEVQGIWAAMREERAPSGPQRLEARQRRAVLQIKGPAGGLPRLTYTLNPIIPCASALVGGRWITSLTDLAPALDAIATTTPDADLLEPRIAAFIGARSERLLDGEVQALGHEGEAPDRVLATLKLLTELQNRFHPAVMKGVTAWIAARSQSLVERWKNRERRAAVDAQLTALAALGFLQPILFLLQDQAGHAADLEGLRSARASVAEIDAELNQIADGGVLRAAFATRLGQEIAAGAGLAALAITLILAAMG
jgi:eukaryotic-like serine/threonine-protein kinase